VRSRHGEHFREQCPDVVEMRENAFGIGIAFAAENFVAGNAESVEKILFLSRGFLGSETIRDLRNSWPGQSRRPFANRAQSPNLDSRFSIHESQPFNALTIHLSRRFVAP
jgi:hypothetical protein